MDMATARRTAVVLAGLALLVGVPSGAAAAPAAAAPAAVPFDDIETDAPLAVRVGSAVEVVPVTAVSGRPLQTVRVAAVDGPVTVGRGESAGPEPGRPLVHKVDVAVDASAVRHWGPHDWLLSGSSGGPEDIGATDAALLELRAHSMLGIATARSGELVRVDGAARAYHNVLDRYVPWAGQEVSVQRYVIGGGWFQLSGARTDARGNVSVVVRAPRETILRLVVKDTGPTWGAVSRDARP